MRVLPTWKTDFAQSWLPAFPQWNLKGSQTSRGSASGSACGPNKSFRNLKQTKGFGTFSHIQFKIKAIFNREMSEQKPNKVLIFLLIMSFIFKCQLLKCLPKLLAFLVPYFCWCSNHGALSNTAHEPWEVTAGCKRVVSVDWYCPSGNCFQRSRRRWSALW